MSKYEKKMSYTQAQEILEKRIVAMRNNHWDDTADAIETIMAEVDELQEYLARANKTNSQLIGSYQIEMAENDRLNNQAFKMEKIERILDKYGCSFTYSAWNAMNDIKEVLKYGM